MAENCQDYLRSNAEAFERTARQKSGYTDERESSGAVHNRTVKKVNLQYDF